MLLVTCRNGVVVQQGTHVCTVLLNYMMLKNICEDVLSEL